LFVSDDDVRRQREGDSNGKGIQKVQQCTHLDYDTLNKTLRGWVRSYKVSHREWEAGNYADGVVGFLSRRIGIDEK
jgi:hypothetical protein